MVCDKDYNNKIKNEKINSGVYGCVTDIDHELWRINRWYEEIGRRVRQENLRRIGHNSDKKYC